MPFTLAEFAARSPYAFHLTARQNLDFVMEKGALYPSELLLREAGLQNWLAEKRGEHVDAAIPGRKIVVRDQAPLHRGNMTLDDGWSFGDFIVHLNRRVFFWAGKKDGRPIDYGRRHFERYAGESPVIIRVLTEDIFAANSAITPEFCRYNSGSPRCSNGKRSPRGAKTFSTCNLAEFRASEVVEITFAASVILPSTAEIGESPDGPWETR